MVVVDRPVWEPTTYTGKPEWRWLLYDFAGPSTPSGTYLGSLEQIDERVLNIVFNGSGSASFAIELDHDQAYQISPLATYIRCERNGVPKWEGKVYGTTEDGESGKMAVECTGWWEELNKRYTIEELTFENMSLGRIAWSLIAHTVLLDGPIGFNVGPAQDAGFVLEKYKIGKDLNIAAEIQKFTQVENGIDFYFDYADRYFKFVNANYADRPDVLFGYKAGPHNLQNLIRRTDGSRVVNTFKAIAPLSGNYVVDVNSTSKTELGTYREIQTLTGLRTTTPEEEQQGLAAFAAAETIVRGWPLQTYEVVVKPPSQTVDVPRVFDEFEEGDKIRLSADRGRLQLDRQPVRCYGFSVALDKSNTERLTSISLSNPGS